MEILRIRFQYYVVLDDIRQADIGLVLAEYALISIQNIFEACEFKQILRALSVFGLVG